MDLRGQSYKSGKCLWTSVNSPWRLWDPSGKDCFFVTLSSEAGPPLEEEPRGGMGLVVTILPTFRQSRMNIKPFLDSPALWIREGDGTPLQYSCLENPMDGGAWKAAVRGVAKSWIRQRLQFHFSLSCPGEGNGNLLQCSSLENPRDGGAWWVAT